MKLGIIGTGMIVKDFLPSLVKLKGLEILCILSTKKSKEIALDMCKEFNITCGTDDFEEFCSRGIDTVYIAVPNYLHFDYCKKCLEKGINVIVEKPMCSNYDESVFLEKLARSKKLFLFEAITTLYMDNYLKIKDLIDKIGQIKIVQSSFCKESSRYKAFCKGEITPVFDLEKSGGTLMDLNVYNIFFVIGLFGEPEKVEYFANIERNIDTSGSLLMKYKDFVAVCTAAKDSNGINGTIIQGTKGIITSFGQPSTMDKILIELNDGSVDEYTNDTKGKVEAEFTAFMKIISDKDYEKCYRQLEKSVKVSKILTDARKKVGIIFEADKDTNVGK